MSALTKGTLIGVVGVLFWSFTAIFISRLTGHYQLPPLLLALWRDLFVSLGLLALLLAGRRGLPLRDRLRIDRAQVPFFLFYGLVLCVFNSIWTLSVPLNGAAVSTVLVYGSSGFTVPLARWLFRERITFAKVAGVILSLTGCVLVANAFSAAAWNARPVGIAVGLLSGLLFAFYSLAGKEAARRRVASWVAMFYTFSFASLFLLLVNLVPGLPGAASYAGGLLPLLPPDGWLLLVTLSLVPTLLGYGLYNLSMHYLPAGIANLIATMEPAFTAAEAYVLLGEVMTPIQVGGSLLIIGAVVLVRLSESAGQAARMRASVQEPEADRSL